MVSKEEECGASRTDVDPGENTMIEVRVYVDGDLVHREQSDSAEQAWLVVDDWAEVGGVSFEVGDLLVQRLPARTIEHERR
jgi:streptomycin 6-kinase